jgi:hypothetical protein
MKKLLPVLVLILLSIQSFADWDLMVCESVDNTGNCIGKSTTFNFISAELPLTVKLFNADGLRTAKIYFEVYLMDLNTYAEDLLTTEEAKTEASQSSVSQTIKFLKKGHYIIKARDAFKDYITSRELEVK